MCHDQQIKKAKSKCKNASSSEKKAQECVSQFNMLLGVDDNDQREIQPPDATCQMSDVPKTIKYNKSNVFCTK